MSVTKIKAMRSPLAGLGPTSAAELDAVYSAHLRQLTEYQKAIPTVDDELNAIVTANGKIATGDFNTALSAAQEMVGAATAAYKALQTVQKLAQGMLWSPEAASTHSAHRYFSR